MIRGLMSDAEWDIFKPFLVPSVPSKGRPAKDHRRTLDGVFFVGRTGIPWRDLPEYFGDFRKVHRQFRRWVASGVFDLFLEAMNESALGQDSVQMIDSSIIRAHQHSAGAKKGVRTRLSDALAVVSRQKST